MTTARDPEHRKPSAGFAPGRTLRRLRERLGLTREEMARLLGVSPRSLGGYELGEREPGSTLLRRLLELGARCTADRLLGVERSAWPRADPRAAALLEALFGLRARCVRESWGPAEGGSRAPERRLCLEGVRRNDGAPFSERHLSAALEMACQGPPAARLAVGQLSLAAADRELVHDDDLHRAAWSADASGHAFDYELRSPRRLGGPVDEGGAKSPVPLVRHEVQLPSDLLELAVHEAPGSDAAPPRLAAWPAVTSYEPEGDVAARLHPSELRATRSGDWWIARVTDPLPGLCYGLTRAPVAVPFPSSSQASSPAGPLREARQRRGLSLREAAARLGVSHGTVRNAESGAELSLSFLRSCLEAFPELAADDLLDPPPAVGPWSPIELWQHLRDAFGLVASSVDKRVRIQEDGRVRTVLRTRGMRDLRGRGELRLREGGLLEALQAAPHVVEAITGRDASLRVRAYREPDGSKRHLLRAKNAGDREGLSYTVRHALSSRPLFYFFARRVGRPPPLHEGSSHAVRFPCERLSLKVTFPAGYEPVSFGAMVLPSCQVPHPTLEPFSSFANLPAVRLSRRGGRLHAGIEVERPLVGFKYAVAWLMP